MKFRPVNLLFFVCLLLLAQPVWADGHCSDDFDGDGAISEFCGGTDCDDGDARRYPGAIEICDPDNVDEDCDVRTIGVVDTDRDGYISTSCGNYQEDGTLLRGLDCDDTRTNINPMAPDLCDGIDNNCDGAFDDTGRITQFEDRDADGHGDPASGVREICPGTVGWSIVDGDCNDSNPAIRAGSMMCDPGGQTAGGILVCTGAGTWQAASCQDGDFCVQQVNGTGVCVPEDSKVKKK